MNLWTMLIIIFKPNSCTPRVFPNPFMPSFTIYVSLSIKMLWRPFFLVINEIIGKLLTIPSSHSQRCMNSLFLHILPTFLGRKNKGARRQSSTGSRLRGPHFLPTPSARVWKKQYSLRGASTRHMEVCSFSSINYYHFLNNCINNTALVHLNTYAIKVIVGWYELSYTSLTSLKFTIFINLLLLTMTLIALILAVCRTPIIYELT